MFQILKATDYLYPLPFKVSTQLKWPTHLQVLLAKSIGTSGWNTKLVLFFTVEEFLLLAQM